MTLVKIIDTIRLYFSRVDGTFNEIKNIYTAIIDQLKAKGILESTI